MLRAIIYTRVSTTSQAEDGTSLEDQEARCLQKAQEIKAEVVDVLTDEGVSGALFLSRPGIQKALTGIETGKANLLITMRLDRTGRDVDVLRLIKRRVERAGGRLVFADGMNFENNAIGNLMFTNLAGFAEYQRAYIRENTIAGSYRRASEGIQPNRTHNAFGYHIVTKADVLRGLYPPDQLGKYQIDPDVAPYAQALFERYAAGESLRSLGRWLESEGVAPIHGGHHWYATTLSGILRNSLYIGEAVYGKTKKVSMGEERLAEGYRHTFRCVRQPEERWIVIEAPALISRALWEQCQKRLQTNRSFAGNPRWFYLLSGMLRCPVCGYAMHGMRNSRGKHYYKCRRDIPAQNCTYRRTPRMEVLDALVVTVIRQIAQNPDLLDNAIRTYQHNLRAARAHIQADQLESELAQLGRDEQATIQAQIAGIQAGARADTYNTILERIARRRREVEALLRERTQVRETAQVLDSAQMTGHLKQFLSALPGLEKTTLRRLLGSVIQQVVPDPEGEGCTVWIPWHKRGGPTILCRLTPEHPPEITVEYPIV